ncbi:hypothetical protein ACROYT_G018299 [Oculina patagonica]
MFSFFCARVAILILGVFAILIYQAVTEVYFDGTKGLKRNEGDGIAYANFAAHKFRYLNLNPLVSTSVKELRECGKLCVDHSSCFSTNLAAFRDQYGWILCELLPSDKYNHSDKFLDSGVFHHFSIKSPCSSDPCMNNATCVAKYKDNDYQCACVPGYVGKHCDKIGTDCQDIKKRGHSQGDGIYWVDPDGGSHSNAFLAYCDMTSYNGGWTMCYTTDEYVKPKSEVTYSAQFPYGSDGYRTNCNNIPFTEIIFIDHQTGNKAYFKRQASQSITSAENYGNAAGTYGLWDGVGADNAFSYQLLICDHWFYSGFFVSGYTGNCYKLCYSWCMDQSSPYFRSASTDWDFRGVAFNINGHRPNVVGNRLKSVGLRLNT